LFHGALILEGGGFRGVYTAGVLDFFIDRKAMFSSVYGISAGACNALNYLSQDRGRYIEIAKRFCNDPRYMGVGQLLKTGSIFNWQFSFYEIPERYIPYDYDTFYASPMCLKVGATDCATGRCHWFSRENGDDLIRDSIASSSMPLLAPMQEIAGRQYLDGGIADSIPVRFFESIGYKRNLIVLTQPKGFVKKKNKMLPAIRARYLRYPAFVEAVADRHERYNETLDHIAMLEQTGKAFVIRPPIPLEIGSMERDPVQLRRVYETGRAVAEIQVDKIAAFVNESKAAAEE